MKRLLLEDIQVKAGVNTWENFTTQITPDMRNVSEDKCLPTTALTLEYEKQKVSVNIHVIW